MLDHNLLSLIGYDRIVIEVPLLAIDSDAMGSAINGIAYADESDDIYLEVLDRSTGEYKHIKTFIVSYATDGSLRCGKTTDKDCIKYAVRVKQMHFNLTGEIKTVALLDIVTGRTAYNTTHNVYNLHDPDMAVSLLDRVKRELEIGGIILGDVSTWELMTAEVNKTIITDDSMIDHKEVYEWLFEQLYSSERYNEAFRHKKKVKDGSESMTYKCVSRSEKIKVYDKTAQIKDTMNIFLDENLIRLEVTWNREALKSKFNKETADMTILSDIERLNESFDYVLNKVVTIVKSNINSEVDRLVSEFKTTGKKELKRVYTSNASTHFDPVIFMKAAQIYYKKVKNKNFSTDIKSIMPLIDPRTKHRLMYLSEILNIFTEKDPELIKLNKTLRKFL